MGLGILDLLLRRTPTPPNKLFSGDSDSRISAYEKDPNDSHDPEVWQGHEVNHVYRADKGFDLDRCPQCKKSIVSWYVGLIYTTGSEFRQHMSPCAYICDDCDLAVVDETQLREYAQEGGHEYKAPIAIYSLDRGPPHPDQMNVFTTYEGNEFAFLLSEDENIEDIVYMSELDFPEHNSEPDTKNKKRKRKAARKAQRMSRRRNRNRS